MTVLRSQGKQEEGGFSPAEPQQALSPMTRGAFS